jgi:hypothetical protein
MNRCTGQLYGDKEERETKCMARGHAQCKNKTQPERISSDNFSGKKYPQGQYIWQSTGTFCPWINENLVISAKNEQVLR